MLIRFADKRGATTKELPRRHEDHDEEQRQAMLASWLCFLAFVSSWQRS
jgi:hypothetical protein